MKISETASLVLSGAAQRNDRLVPRRSNVPPVADISACRALVKQGLLEVVQASADVTGLVIVREADNPIAFIIADAGFRAINLELPGKVTASSASPAPGGRMTLREAAAAVVADWEHIQKRSGTVAKALAPSMAALCALLASREKRVPGAPRKPREGTKQQTVLGMLRRPKGTSIAQVMDATGWASHTVHGFFAGLKKQGFPVTVLERVRQDGPAKAGAKGSYSIYGINAER